MKENQDEATEKLGTSNVMFEEEVFFMLCERYAPS